MIHKLKIGKTTYTVAKFNIIKKDKVEPFININMLRNGKVIVSTHKDMLDFFDKNGYIKHIKGNNHNKLIYCKNCKHVVWSKNINEATLNFIPNHRKGLDLCSKTMRTFMNEVGKVAWRLYDNGQGQGELRCLSCVEKNKDYNCQDFIPKNVFLYLLGKLINIFTRSNK